MALLSFYHIVFTVLYTYVRWMLLMNEHCTDENFLFKCIYDIDIDILPTEL